MHRLTLVCDICGQEFMLEESMDLPPYWLAVQIGIGDKDGFASDDEQKYNHFCSQECFIDFAKGPEIKERLMLIDKRPPTQGDNNDDD